MSAALRSWSNQLQRLRPSDLAQLSAMSADRSSSSTSITAAGRSISPALAVTVSGVGPTCSGAPASASSSAVVEGSRSSAPAVTSANSSPPSRASSRPAACPRSRSATAASRRSAASGPSVSFSAWKRSRSSTQSPTRSRGPAAAMMPCRFSTKPSRLGSPVSGSVRASCQRLFSLAQSARSASLRAVSEARTMPSWSSRAWSRSARAYPVVVAPSSATSRDRYGSRSRPRSGSSRLPSTLTSRPEISGPVKWAATRSAPSWYAVDVLNGSRSIAVTRSETSPRR